MNDLKISQTISRNVATLFIVVLLASCGGGGGGSGGGGAAPDTTPPTVSSTSLVNNVTGVVAITATFSENILASTITTATFTLNNGMNSVTGTVIYSDSTATFTPSTNLIYSTLYTATISTAVKDAAGNAMAANKIWTFTTTAAPVFDRLNDTGQTLCYDNAASAVCTTVAINSGTHPRQDTRFGRDAKAAAVVPLSKTGAGAAGFDFTKVCMNGSLNCTTLASNAAAPAATTWACTKDNNTNLIWSLQTQSDTWANATSTLPAAANSASRCGFATEWRLPTRRELLTIVHNGKSIPAIDTAYFTGTASNYYWSKDTFKTDSAYAWVVYFYDGSAAAYDKTYSNPVRLVRSGQ